MQKIGLIALVMAALGSAAMLAGPLAANEAPANPREKPPVFAGLGTGIERIERELKLTDAQKAQLRVVRRDFEQQANDIRQDNLLSRAEKESRLGALRRGLDTRIKALLTADQIRTFDQMGGLEGMTNGPRGLEIIWRSLTEAQQKAIASLIAQQQPAFAAAGGNVEKLRELKQAAWQKMLAVLTPEQQQTLKLAAERAAAEREQAEKAEAEREHEGQ